MTIPTNILHVELVNLISSKYLSQIWICVTIFYEHSYIRQKRFPKPIKEVRLCQFVEQNLFTIFEWRHSLNNCKLLYCKATLQEIHLQSEFFHRSNGDSNVLYFHMWKMLLPVFRVVNLNDTCMWAKCLNE